MNGDASSRIPVTAGGPRARPLRSLLTFVGRLGRGQFFVYAILWHVVFGVGASIAFAVLVAPTFAFTDGRVAGGAVMGFAALAAVGYGLSAASLGVWRLHDLGRSGLWMLLAFVPLVNLALAAVLLLAPGSDRRERARRTPAGAAHRLRTGGHRERRNLRRGHGGGLRRGPGVRRAARGARERPGPQLIRARRTPA